VERCHGDLSFNFEYVDQIEATRLRARPSSKDIAAH